ncbi:DUF3304 domain-containing protein [Cupriavidus sp. 2MCAB6]|uniref:DUF3304 domain-containing protein n=1 Tax=Cupriavidus sp. 2MCAB6 TaxID=3232981 RepID=UPI003F90A9B9
MNILRWPAKIPERDSGRLPEGLDTHPLGKAKVIDPLGACEQTIHVNLFFDGADNNDDKQTHRRNAAKHDNGGVARMLWRLCVSLSLVAALGACSDRLSAWLSPLFSDAEVEAASTPDRMLSAGVSGFNYTPYYIDGFGITGPDGSGGGGPTIMPAPPGERTGGGAENCCISIPAVWRPGMSVSIRWTVNKVLDGKTPGLVYRATSTLPEYGELSGSMWAIFLPGDRVKVMVSDSTNGRRADIRPGDDDPFIAHGVLDEEETKGVRARSRLAYCADDERNCPPRLQEKNYAPGGPCTAGLPCPPTSKKEKNR